MKKALVTEVKFSKKHEDILKKAGVDVYYERGDLNEEQLISKLTGFDIYVIGGSDRATKKVIESTKLELIVFWGTGYHSYIDFVTAKTRGIEAANTPHSNAYTVAEHTVALILNSVKKITYFNNKAKNGDWISNETWNLESKTLGIIGFGAIGSKVARIMHNAFKMNILYYSTSSKSDLEKELNARRVDLNTLMSQSDIVSIHIPLTEETRHIISNKELSLMQEHAILINCARADLVEPKSLKEVLENGKISSAAFDVYYVEPGPTKENDVWGLLTLPDDKFILTPHTAYSSREAIDTTNEMTIENILTYLKTGNPKYKVN